ncbi:Gfo/Idh/MocA family oxidoreductase [Streptomonospora litoralis]|uniref:Oxidoreductase family, NAD-binding Rossmann fold n=1 Tax=Streptomonospora litoralis TaxID=2498135 RepID=A0A4P6Q7V7_9ACTN|nr:oxidoreductase [Streptomonospora litoralis]QBI55531.1 Oxidoreductase family, NAD-binding Rossmann fold [Streptomonospora litoralis]
MLHTLVVGLGRSGRGLHLPALVRARAQAGRHRVFSPGPDLVYDPRPPSGGLLPNPGVRAVPSLRTAAEAADPARTVAHLCTPPGTRVKVLEELARLGYRRILIEKPLAADEVELAAVLRLRRRFGLQTAVVAQWLTSALTHRLRAAVREGRLHGLGVPGADGAPGTAPRLGRLRTLRIVQRKPRFVRSLTSRAHPTAFDVELPHSVGVALTLAGGARVRSASWSDMALGNVEVPHLGQAHLVLEHRTGARTEILSDLTAPTRERRIVCEFDRGSLTGHYPCSEDDDTAQLRSTTDDGSAHLVFHDDALADFLLGAYEHFAGLRALPLDDAFGLQVRAVRLLSAAKDLCAGHTDPGAVGSASEERTTCHADLA